MTKEALKLALEALVNTDSEPSSKSWKREIEAITAIKETLAQPEQEPVGEIVDAIEGAFKCSFTKMLPVGTKLYTTPPQRKPLTDEELNQIEGTHIGRSFAKAIEAKLKEKNT